MTNQYIKQCDHPAIQEKWETKFGDEFDDPEVEGPSYIQFDNPSDNDVKKRGCIWLPRIEDYIRLQRETGKWESPYWLMESFMD